MGKLTTRQYPGATHSVTTPRLTGPVQGSNQPKIKGLHERAASQSLVEDVASGQAGPRCCAAFQGSGKMGVGVGGRGGIDLRGKWKQ